MVIGEGDLPIGFATVFSFFFWLCVLFWCFVSISNLYFFLKMLMCHVMIGGQKILIFCHIRIAAALIVERNSFVDVNCFLFASAAPINLAACLGSRSGFVELVFSGF